MKIIKKTPITWNGEDGWEVLVSSGLPFLIDHCDYCMYEDWSDDTDPSANCAIVHGCGELEQTHFAFQLIP